jgi:hypothetical protein
MRDWREVSQAPVLSSSGWTNTLYARKSGPDLCLEVGSALKRVDLGSRSKMVAGAVLQVSPTWWGEVDGRVGR